MTVFNYRARTKDGRVESDTLTAATRAEAVSALRAQGLSPLSVSVQSVSAGLSGLNWSKIFHRISLEEKLTFVKNLSLLIRSGVALPRAIKILAAQSTNAYFQEILGDIGKSVEGGTVLSQAFARHPEVFSNLYVSLTEVGESAGNLDQSLDYLHVLLKRQSDLIRKTKGALMYPAVVVATLIVVGVLMFIFVLPKLTATFKDVQVELPPLTRVVIGIVDVLSANAIISVGVLVVAIAGAFYGARTPEGRRLIDRITLILPIISGITKQINLARFTLTLGSLLKSSMQIVGALQITSRSLDNQYYREAVAYAAEQVRVGVNLSDALQRYPKLFPSLVAQMIKVGEESGRVEEILKELGEYYEEEVDQIMKNMSSIIEPALVVVIGAVVAVIALALIMPIYSITQAI